jgi:hypothetical protein
VKGFADCRAGRAAAGLSQGKCGARTVQRPGR